MSLHIQSYLRNGKTTDDLTEELGIRVYEHPTLPIVGFKYNQIDSPKMDEVVREARGVVLEKDTWNIVAKGFNRFFNVGEAQEEFKKFRWDSFTVQEKEDGSLILLYFYDGRWHANTSGSFGFKNVNCSNHRWSDLFWKTSGLNPTDPRLEPYKTLTIACELCTPYNKVVRRYPRSSVFLLSSFHTCNDLSIESSMRLSDSIAKELGIKRPNVYPMTSMDEIKDFMSDWDVAMCGRLEDHDNESIWARCPECPPLDPNKEVHEGLVLRDVNGQRWKWKTRQYAAMHHMKDNGNIVHPKNLVPICLAGETAEVKLLMPEVSTALDSVNDELHVEWGKLASLWEGAKHLTSQKDFALRVKEHKLSAMLFSLRKVNQVAPLSELQKIWRRSDAALVKYIFRKRIYEFDVLDEVETGG